MVPSGVYIKPQSGNSSQRYNTQSIVCQKSLMSVGRITPVTIAQCDFYWTDYERYRLSWTKKLAAKYQRDCQKFFDRELRQPPTLVE